MKWELKPDIECVTQKRAPQRRLPNETDFMKFTYCLLSVAMIVLSGGVSEAWAEDVTPAPAKTVMTTRGKLLLSEDFTQPMEVFEGKTNGFASGFTGWCYRPGALKRNLWAVTDGVLTGTEVVEAHHPATISYGIDFKNVVIQVDVRLNDVPDGGRKYRSLFVKATDEKDYVCGIFVGTSGLSLVPYDSTTFQPGSKQRGKSPAASVAAPIKLGEWHTLVMEILGDEMAGTMDGKSAWCANPLIGLDKHSIMFGVGTEASYRHFRVWEALPNPEWAKVKATLPTAKKTVPTGN